MSIGKSKGSMEGANQITISVNDLTFDSVEQTESPIDYHARENNQFQDAKLNKRNLKLNSNHLTIEDPKDNKNFKIAINRLSELLKHPDDLNVKIDFLRRKLIQEKATVETQLRTDVQTQYDDIQETFGIFQNADVKLKKVKEKIQSVGVLCKENQTKIPGYETIKELSRVHSNMVATHKYVKRFQVFQQQINLIEQLIVRAKIPEGLNSVNLLSIHYELFHVEEFRDITIHYSKKCSNDVQIQLKNMFKKVDQVSNEFSTFIWDIVKDFYGLIESGNLKHILHIIKIVECEELADRKALQVENAKTQSLKFAGQRAGNRWKLAEGSPRSNKAFKTQLFNALKEAVDARFKQHFETIDKDNLYQSIAVLETIPSDLKDMNDILFSSFPPSYNIFDFFVNEYHKRIYSHLESLVSDVSKLIGEEILEIMRFIQNYHDELSQELGVSESSLEPPLLGGNQFKLVEGYLAIVTSELCKWTSNAIQIDSNAFLTRDKEPHVNLEGNYYLTASNTAFESYDEQIELAFTANSARVLVEVIKCCAKMAQVYQQRFSDIMKNELERYLDDPSSVSQGFVEYVIALMNDQLRSVDSGDPLITKISGMLHDVYKERATSYINEMSDGFFKLASQGVDVIIKVIFNDLKALFAQMYTPVWYEEDLILCAVATFEDYCEDAKIQLNPFLFGLLMEKLLETTILNSIEAFQNRNAKLILPDCAVKMENETKALQDFFLRYISDPKVVNSKIDPLLRLQNLAAAPAKMIFLEFYPLRKQYSDMPISLIEQIIGNRTDLDRSERREVLESIRTKDAELDYQDIGEPSVFSKIQLNNNIFGSAKFF